MPKISNKNFFLIALFLYSVTVHADHHGQWQMLFNNKNLDGWDTYLGPKYSTEKGDFDGKPIGLNTDPYQVFTVVKLADGKMAIRISGEHFGGLSTVKEYQNYHLQLQFKWGENKFAPRHEAKRDSGLLYHATGKHGADWYFWMRSLEMQIQEGDCGDFWGLGGNFIDIPAVKNKDGEYIYQKDAPLTTFQANLDTGNHVIKADNGNAEKPNGEWNTLELYSVGETSVHVVNGVVKMILRNPRQMLGEKKVPLLKGKIQIQSEGAEVYYRDIKIRQIEGIPGEIFGNSNR